MKLTIMGTCPIHNTTLDIDIFAERSNRHLVNDGHVTAGEGQVEITTEYGLFNCPTGLDINGDTTCEKSWHYCVVQTDESGKDTRLVEDRE